YTMAPSLVRIDASEQLENILHIIERDGAVIVTNFLAEELLKESMDASESQFGPHLSGRKMYDSKASHGELGADFFPEGSQRVYLIKIVRLPVWQGIMARFLNDEFASYTGETLLPQKSGYMLASTAALRLVPGAKSQPLHRQSSFHADDGLLGCRIEMYIPKRSVIPGSHLWGVNRAPKKEEATYAEMEPATYHGAGENKCGNNDPDALRTLFAILDYYRQDQEEVLSTPLEIARELPEDILRLAGYYKSVGGVGFVEDHQHPVEFLQKDQTGIGKFVSAAKVAV
ncbi:unnamed protein product, partial [Aureobasidium pullulans]